MLSLARRSGVTGCVSPTYFIIFIRIWYQVNTIPYTGTFTEIKEDYWMFFEYSFFSLVWIF